MMIKKAAILGAIVLFGMLLTATVTPAQDGQGDSTTATPMPTGEPVTATSVLNTYPVHAIVEASDGLVLVGDYYPVQDGMAHTGVLLIHMLGGNRSAYAPLIPHLTDAGYAVLNVDMRGHGETGGGQDWAMAVEDVGTWLGWMNIQPDINADSLAIVGASIGGNLALMGCDANPSCVTAIALSPGQDYRGVMPEDALFSGSGTWSAYLIASHDDTYSAQSIEWFFANAPGEVSARLYPGRAHGTNLFNNELDSVGYTVISWLDEHTGSGQ